MITTTHYFDEMVREWYGEMVIRECSDCGARLFDAPGRDGEVTCQDHGGPFGPPDGGP